jgi:hypothetical protein
VGTGPRKLHTHGIPGQIIGGAIDGQRYLGPGMLERAKLRGLSRGGAAYLRFADLYVGLLFNFNVAALAAGGWKRVLRRG